MSKRTAQTRDGNPKTYPEAALREILDLQAQNLELMKKNEFLVLQIQLARGLRCTALDEEGERHVVQ